jgi:alkanesulfonate monooxygenase SsuD/methylene tetrahydromethanopterin reductase-like flavin-dependent oxidoreductase (luciferase family)
VQLIVPGAPGALRELLSTGKRVEQLGYDALFIFDHPWVHADPWTALSALAVATDRVRLGSVVNCVSYRSPVHFARLASDLDNLSGGRAIFGIGSGWWEAEYRALGVPFPSIGQRQAALDEALEIVQGVWGDAPFSYGGRHYAVDQVQIVPAPVQRPRPPILIGGSGEKKTLRQVARFGDACNVKEPESLGDRSIPDGQRAASLARKLAALDAHCADLGRLPQEILRTHFTSYLILAPTEREATAKLDALDPQRSTSPGTRREGKGFIFASTPDRAIAYYQAIRAVGIQYFVVQLDGSDLETIELLATQVAPAIA